MNNKDKNRLAKQFDNASPAELGEALASAIHVLNGADQNAKVEAALVKEYIESLGLAKEEIKAPETVKVECVRNCTVDGVPFSKGNSGSITRKQYNALSRFFKVVSALALLALLGCFAASAQTYKINAIGIFNGNSSAVIAASTTTAQQKIGVTQEKNFCVQLNCALMASGTSAFTLTEYHAGDGTNYSATGATATVNGNGTTPVSLTWERTNMVSGYYSYTIQNGNTAIATNVQFLHVVAGVKAL